MTKFLMVLAIVAACGSIVVAAPAEDSDDSEDEEVKVSIDEIETSIETVVETYMEYEYEYEYEYEGALALGGEVIGGFGGVFVVCPSHFIRDCSGVCAPAHWIGNGLCDDGGMNTGTIGAANFPFVSDGDITSMPDTNPANLKLPPNERASEDKVAYNFNCAQFWSDGGDCTSKDESIQDLFNMRWAAAVSLEVGGRQLGALGVPTLAVAAMAVVGIAAVAMRH